jgi:glycosyltransferase involved in cell wall biosynthesis
MITQLTYPKLYRAANEVIAISQYVATWLKRFAQVDARLIPLGIARVVDTGPTRPSTRKLLYVGEVSSRKGIRDLVQGLHRASSDVTLDVVGKGDYEPFLVEANRLRVADRIRFRGILEQSALSDAYASAFCTCTASLWEGFGLPVLEGFSFGIPAVVRAQGGMLELVQQSNAGCSFHQPAEMASCIEAVTQDWEGLSERARQFALRNTWRITFEAYRDVFTALL